ncbi:MAG: hypothetical protein R3E79_41225 [Caldilineaceae bacterium]
MILERLEQEVLTLVEERNRQAATVRWQFTSNWRVKFQRFYLKLAAQPDRLNRRLLILDSLTEH